MVIIQGTNIIVDDFKPTRPFRENYVYFLTHFHYGINHTWIGEKIYCSEITKRLLLNRYPQLMNVTALSMNEPHVIYLDEKKSHHVQATFLNANHCIGKEGSVMILFEGYMGTILSSGDFRYSPRMLYELERLFPAYQRNENNDGCSIHIDEIILDDTYCDPVFQFPSRIEAFQEIVEIIMKHPENHICIAIDTVGKEELLAQLADFFETRILVEPSKFTTLSLAEFHLKFFTQDHYGAWLEVIRKFDIRKRLREGCVVLVPTGWCNEKSVLTEKNHYVIGYSLHCNYQEICDFVKSIRPAKISTDWKTQIRKMPLEKLKKKQLNKFEFLKNIKQSGLTFLINEYSRPDRLSPEYKYFMNLDNLAKIKETFGILLTDEVKKQRNRKLWEKKYSYVYENKKKNRTGAKIAPFHLNDSLRPKDKEIIKKQQAKLPIIDLEEEEYAVPQKKRVLNGDSDSNFTGFVKPNDGLIHRFVVKDIGKFFQLGESKRHEGTQRNEADDARSLFDRSLCGTEDTRETYEGEFEKAGFPGKDDESYVDEEYLGIDPDLEEDKPGEIEFQIDVQNNEKEQVLIFENEKKTMNNELKNVEPMAFRDNFHFVDLESNEKDYENMKKLGYFNLDEDLFDQ